jgi:polysaccharide chain length determinant protein (PEP-CTERM system associated)
MIEVSDLPRPLIRYGVGVWRRRWLVVAVAWLAALLGWIGVWLLPDRFESRAQVFVQTETILEPVMTGVTARPNYEQRVQVMQQQLLTRPNVQEIIYRSGLDKTIKARSDADRRVAMEGLIDWVGGDIKIESPQQLYFNITYRNGDPETARRVVDAVLNLLIEQDLGAGLQEKEEARRLLEAEIARFDERLTAKENEVAAFRRKHNEELALVEGNARQNEQMKLELARVSDQLSQEERRAATLRTLLSTTPRTSAGTELDQLKVQLAQLRSQYKESYPDIQNIKARIAQLESGGLLPENPEFRRLQNELVAAEGMAAQLKSRESAIRSELETLAIALSDAPAVQAELQRIIRDYEQTQKTYDELIQRRDRLSLTASLGAGGRGVEYQVFERPTAALRPVAPPRLLFILGILVSAFAVGGGVALLATHLDRTYTQTADLEQAFGLPILGSIGVVRSAFTRKMQREDMFKLAGACGALAILALAYIYASVLRTPSHAAATGAQTASLSSAPENR